MARITLVAVLLGSLLVRGDAGAQSVQPCPPHCEWSSAPGTLPHVQTASHLTLAAVNIALGGVTAGTTLAIRGASFREVLSGLAQGAAGGAAVYGGKALVGADVGRIYDGPVAFTGRAVAAAGASVTRNAGAGIGPLDHIVLPVGPTRLHVRRTEPPGQRVHMSVDLVAIAGLGAMVLTYDDLRLDVGSTLWSGAPTFRTTSAPRETWRGQHLAGAIVVRQSTFDHTGGSLWTGEERVTLAHERVHLIQYDQAFIQWSDPVERALLRALTGGDRLGRHLDLSLHALAVGLLGAWIPYDRQPWEIEAHSFANPPAYSAP